MGVIYKDGINFFVTEKEESSFIIVFENEKVLDVESLEEALKFCLALYFILNVQYPKQISCTLEMLQRYHLKIHPDTGSKSEGVTVKRKVLNLMTRMKNI